MNEEYQIIKDLAKKMTDQDNEISYKDAIGFALMVRQNYLFKKAHGLEIIDHYNKEMPSNLQDITNNLEHQLSKIEDAIERVGDTIHGISRK